MTQQTDLFNYRVVNIATHEDATPDGAETDANRSVITAITLNGAQDAGWRSVPVVRDED